MEDYNEQPEKISKYNSGIAQIYRVDNLWKNSHHHRCCGELILWNWDLDSVWCELVGDLKEDDERIEKFAELDKEVGLNLMKDKRLLYKSLMNKEIFLRRLQNKLGKGTALMDANEDMIE